MTKSLKVKKKQKQYLQEVMYDCRKAYIDSRKGILMEK